MVKDAARKRVIRERMRRTGESYTEAARAIAQLVAPPAVDPAAPDVDQATRTAAVLRLFGDSFDAFAAGDREDADRYLGWAALIDPFCVSGVHGGIMIGQIPNPEHNPDDWDDYLAAAMSNASDVEPLIAWARTQSPPSVLKDPVESALARLTRDDYGPVQILEALTMTVWQFERARRAELIPGPDAPGDRWSARAVAEVLARLDTVMAEVGSIPDIGAHRAADILAEKFALEVEPYVLHELARTGLIPKAGTYKGSDLFDGRAIEKFTDQAALTSAIKDGRLHNRDQAAAYMQIRRSDLDHLIRAGRLAPVFWGLTPYQPRRAAGMVPMFRAGDLDAQLAAADINWDEVRAVAPGRPSLLAALPDAKKA
ncbi:hypothetical protein AB0A95_33895 [Micromonospora sp. NPDC049230]|uniref:hypothetical protein n=1 Tax=Micromonospora sp. NPDC049230 TaxID=3155502 RepID=UPI0034041C3A